MTKFKQSIGRHGENFAEQYLINHHYQIIKRNWRKNYFEVDIIAQKDCFLVFVEVKTRFDDEYPPEEAVNKKKLSVLKKAAEFYRMQYPTNLPMYRIDMVAVVLNRNYQAKRISLYENIADET